MEELSPEQQVTQLMSGYWISQSLYVVTSLNVSDLIGEETVSVSELAREASVHPQNLYRVMRALASIKIFEEVEPRHFRNTPMSNALRKNVPGSQWAMIKMMGEEHYEAFGQLLHTVQTGENAFEHIFQQPIFQYLSERPEKAALFDQAMTSAHGRETDPVEAAYDFSPLKIIVDIGGGNGSVLATILEKNEHLHGILFDMPHVVERAKNSLKQYNIGNRCKTAGGDFFEGIPSGADLYMMRHIIHDWDDEKSIKILENCRQAMGNDGRLLVLEGIVPPGNDPSFSKMMDLAMMVLPGGMERTEEEYRQLFEKAGLTLNQVIPTESDISILEAIPAETDDDNIQVFM